MTDSERSHIEAAAAALADPAMPVPVFWCQKVDAALKGTPDVDQLPILAAMISEAEQDKLDGYGPPQSAIDNAKRRYIRIASEVYRTNASIK